MVEQSGDWTSFLGHFAELRTRLIASLLSILALSVLCYALYDPIIGLLTAPFREASMTSGGEALYLNSIYEGFMIRLKIAVFAGLILSLPVLLYNIFGFIFPALRAWEKKILLWSLVVSFILLVAGAYYGYTIILPVMIRFFLNTGFLPAGTGILLSFGKNIFYILQFLILAVLVFQLPLILELLMILRIVKRKAVFRAARLIIVGIFVLAAIVTPSPDAFSQLAVALPLTILFLLTLLAARIFRFGEER
jgi:sec-independent protein translocase protein TatC